MAATVQDVTTEVSIAPQTEEDYEAEVLVLWKRRWSDGQIYSVNMMNVKNPVPFVGITMISYNDYTYIWHMHHVL